MQLTASGQGSEPSGDYLRVLVTGCIDPVHVCVLGLSVRGPAIGRQDPRFLYRLLTKVDRDQHPIRRYFCQHEAVRNAWQSVARSQRARWVALMSAIGVEGAQ